MGQGLKADRVDAGGTGLALRGPATVVFLEDTLQRLGEKGTQVLALFSILAVAVIGILDGLTGYEFGLSPFYLIPITVVSFYGGKRSGIATALFATAAWYLAEVYARHPYTNPLAIYWNTGVRLLIFVFISLMLTRLRNNMVVEKAQRAKLAELNRLKNQFVGMAAHDLRTPLAVIWMCAESLQKRQCDVPDRRQAEFLKVILEKSDFMLRMVADLLDLSAIESGSLTLRKSRGDYGDFVRRHIEVLQALAERKRLTLEFEGGALPAVSFDEGRIEQVLDNLVMNAVKFSPPRTAITVSVSLEGGQVVTRVTDRGPGIPPEDLPRVFMAFTKTSLKPAGGEKGAGLGLAIAKKIVEAHGGEIAVRSVRGEGATFLFTLCPCALAEPRSPGAQGFEGPSDPQKEQGNREQDHDIPLPVSQVGRGAVDCLPAAIADIKVSGRNQGSDAKNVGGKQWCGRYLRVRHGEHCSDHHHGVADHDPIEPEKETENRVDCLTISHSAPPVNIVSTG